jgi:hypothetical protein
MTYQPYPTGGGGYQQYPAGGGNLGERPPRPQSVRIAVILMYAGAALSAISLIITLAFVHRLESAIATSLRHARTTKPFTAAQIHAGQVDGVIAIVIVLLITIGLWVWMAWANNRGRAWARIVASVLYALNTIWLLLSLRNLGGPSIFYGVGWLIGLAALIFLWRRDTTQYIAQSQASSMPGGRFPPDGRAGPVSR